MENETTTVKRICVIGALKFGDWGGQPVKTRELYFALVERFGAENVSYLETENIRKGPLRFLSELIRKIRQNDSVIMLPARRGVQVLAPLLRLLSKKRRIRLYYAVVGGWLPELLKKKKFLRRQLIKFNGLLVETNTMKKALERMGFINIIRLDNFRKVKSADISTLPEQLERPYRLCFFSRVIPSKGIEDALYAVKSLNEKYGRILCTLDIYGPAQPAYLEKLMQGIPDFIKYQGVVPANESADILKVYSVLLFPTRIETEGMPGTVLDSFYAGVPVLAARWNSFVDVVDEGYTGLGYTLGNREELTEKLDHMLRDESALMEMKKNCLLKASYYSPQCALDRIAFLFE